MLRNYLFVLTSCFIVASSLPLAAETPKAAPGSSVRDAISRLPIQPGVWEGEAWFRTGPGEPQKIQQSERIETRLDGVVLLIEGIGRAEDGTIVHHAFATLGWDAIREKYRMAAWLSDGSLVEPDTSFEDGIFTWSFQVPDGPRMRYRISSPSEEIWEETGHISFDEGATWRSFFGMTLHRVDGEEVDRAGL